MRRTLLAVEIAVLASMIFAPHLHEWRRGYHYTAISNWTRFPLFAQDNNRRFSPYLPAGPQFYPSYSLNPVLWDVFAAQTAFAAVLAAVLVNLRKSSRRNEMVN